MSLLDWLRRQSFRRSAESALRDSQKAALKYLESRLQELAIHHALIGGVAMAIYGAVRGTKDIDYLIDGEREREVHALFTELGFETLHRSPDVSSYLLGQLRVDILYARRPHSRAMLARARAVVLDETRLLAVQPDDIVGLKLQALMHQPSRLQDRADIVTLLRLHGGAMDKARLREYAALLGMEDVLDELEGQT